MCDLTDEFSIQSVPRWIEAIEDNATVLNAVIILLANKCDQLDNINQNLVLDLEKKLETKYPYVTYIEVSVLFNIELKESMETLADALQNNLMNFAQ